MQNFFIKRYICVIFFFAIFIKGEFLLAQPSNDDCLGATTIPESDLDGRCVSYNKTGATVDSDPLFASGCDPNTPFVIPGSPGTAVWFKFVAVGTDVEVIFNPTFNTDISIISFGDSPCSSGSMNVIGCGVDLATNTVDLVPGQTYYIRLLNNADKPENYQLCVRNIPPPPNDDPCDAQAVVAGGPCVDGTNVAADQDAQSSPDPGCSVESMVWYKTSITAPDNKIKISIPTGHFGGDIEIIVATFPNGCSGSTYNLIGSYCGPPPSTMDPFKVFVDPNVEYYIGIGTTKANSGDFQLCIEQSSPVPECAVNGTCATAITLPTPVSDQNIGSCKSACNIGVSTFSYSGPGCQSFSNGVVWFSVTTDATAGLMNIRINSTEMSTPMVQVFTSCGPPPGAVPNGCATGSNGTVNLTGVTVGANTTYYIAVSNASGNEGHFDICVATFQNTSACTISKDLTVTNTSLGSPFNGPYLPGEVVTFCYKVTTFTPQNNGCQWLQGIVPIFGSGWDPASFDPDGKPSGAPNPPQRYAGVWGWYDENRVHYNHDNIRILYYTDPVNGRLKICSFIDPECNGSPLYPGAPMPAGWYSYVPAMGPEPDFTYGDGNSCFAPMGPWEVCFSLKARDHDGEEGCDPTGLVDCSVRVFTFADGETGSWSGSGNVCGADLPKFIKAVNSCCLGPVINPKEVEICSGDTLSIQITSDKDPEATYSWSSQGAYGITGSTPGSGNYLNQILVNTTNVPRSIKYQVSGKSDGCPGKPVIYTIKVLPNVKNLQEIDAAICFQKGDEQWHYDGDQKNYFPGKHDVKLKSERYHCDSVVTLNIAGIRIIPGIKATGSLQALYPINRFVIMDGREGISEIYPAGAYAPGDITYEWTLPDGTKIKNEGELKTYKPGEFTLTICAGKFGVTCCQSITWKISATGTETPRDSMYNFMPFIYIPNAFSPNGDGNNDVLRIYDDGQTILHINQFVIMDRNGRIVYEEKNTNLTDMNGWDGLDRNNKQRKEGVYTYYLEVVLTDLKIKVVKGNTTLFP